MRAPQPPAWLGTPDLTPIATENRAGAAVAYLRSLAGLGYGADDRIRIIAQMLAVECGQAPSLEQAADTANYAGHLMGYATAAAWHGRVAALLAAPQGSA